MTQTNPTALARAPQPAPIATFNRASRDAKDIAAMLEQAASQCHLVSPATNIGALPEGCAVVTSAILVDVGAETYGVGGGDDDDGGGKGGKRGLGKTALDRIALAAGVSWDPHQSRRLDDARDPRYCAWLAVGTFKGFDGREVTIQASKEVDLREGSPQLEALWSRYKAKLSRWERDGKKGWKPKPPDAQIREQRLHIVSMAETKARLRAIRALGIRTSYTPEELRKPFVVAKIAFTGETTDPQLRREFARMQAASFLDARRALYGDVAPPRLALPPPTSAPPVGSVVDADDDVVDAEPVETPAPHTTQAPSEPAPAHTPRPAGNSTPGDAPNDSPSREAPPVRTGWTIPGGREKGVDIGEASTKTLEWWANAIEENLANGRTKPQFVEKDEQLAAAMRAELARRSGDRPVEPHDEEPPPDDDIPF